MTKTGSAAVPVSVPFWSDRFALPVLGLTVPGIKSLDIPEIPDEPEKARDRSA